MSNHTYSSNQNSGIDLRRIIREKPITSLALVAVFSLVVGLGLVIQSDQMLTSNSRASTSNAPMCPAGTIPLFYKTGSLNSSNISIPGTIINSTSGSWKLSTRNGNILAYNGDKMRLTFPNPVRFEKVLIYDNDPDDSRESAWTLNGQTLPTTANNAWYPIAYDLPNKGPFNYLEFNNNHDSPNFNVCVPQQPPNITITSTPPPATRTPTAIQFACSSLRLYSDNTNNPNIVLEVNSTKVGPYYAQLLKNGVNTGGRQYIANNPGYINTVRPTSTTVYKVQLSLTATGPVVDNGSICQVTYSPNPTVTPTPSIPVSTRTPTPALNTSCNWVNKLSADGGYYTFTVGATNTKAIRAVDTYTNSVVLTNGYVNSTTRHYLTYTPGRIYRIDVQGPNDIWVTGSSSCTLSSPTNISPTGEPIPSGTM